MAWKLASANNLPSLISGKSTVRFSRTTQTVTQCTYPEFPDNWRNMYSIESLKEIFLEHGTQSEEGKAQNIKTFQEQNPGEPLPEFMTEPFNLCFALYSICDELSKIRDKTGH